MAKKKKVEKVEEVKEVEEVEAPVEVEEVEAPVEVEEVEAPVEAPVEEKDPIEAPVEAPVEEAPEVSQRNQGPADTKVVKSPELAEGLNAMIGTPTAVEGVRTDVTSKAESPVVKTSGELPRKRELPSITVVSTDSNLVNTGFTI